MRSSWILAGLISFMLASSVRADPMIEKGTQELSVAGSLDFLGATGDTLVVEAGYGVFVRDRVEIRVTALARTVEDIAPGENDYRLREIDGGAEYHFDLGGALVPYLGVELGWRKSKFGSTRESGFVYGPRGGVKYFIADNVAIDFTVAYKLATNDVFLSDFEARDDKLMGGFGLRVMF